ncbi:MAG: VTT domain-containing protein [Thiobacillus sp.]
MHRHFRLLGVLLFLASALAAFELSGLRAHFSLDYLRQTLAVHPVGGLLTFMAIFTLGNLVQIPGWIFLAAAVLTLGKTGGGLATYLAALLACSVTFFAIRLLGGDALRKIDTPLAKRLLSQLDAHPIRNIAALRVVFQTLPPLNYALALSGVRFRDYFMGTLLGLPLPITVYCLLFDYLGHLIQLQ